MSPEKVTKKSFWLTRKYGSRRGMVRTFWHRLLYLFGRYRQYNNIDWSDVDRLVFICKGNICRSVYAESVARSLGIDAISCGLDTIEDAPAHVDAVDAAERSGFNLRKHKTLPVMYVDLKKTDLLIAMEPWQIKFLEKNLNRKRQCSLLGMWVRPRLPHIQDPYGTSDDYFDRCFASIRQGVSTIAGNLH